jgi:hypothetical protein
MLRFKTLLIILSTIIGLKISEISRANENLLSEGSCRKPIIFLKCNFLVERNFPNYFGKYVNV